MTDSLFPCIAPQRCGSDGKECCHPQCQWSPEKKVQREHLKVLAQLARNA